MTSSEQQRPDAEQEQKTGRGTRDDGRAEGTAAELDAGLPGREPGDGEGGMGDHMGAGEFGNDFGRYGGTRTRPEDTKQNANADQLDAEVGHTDKGPRDGYGRPVADGKVDADEAAGDGEGAGETEPAGGYGPADKRAADDTLGGYGGVAGGKDFRPQQQRKRDKGRST
jgi:hypothetical protein